MQLFFCSNKKIPPLPPQHTCTLHRMMSEFGMNKNMHYKTDTFCYTNFSYAFKVYL